MSRTKETIKSHCAFSAVALHNWHFADARTVYATRLAILLALNTLTSRPSRSRGRRTVVETSGASEWVFQQGRDHVPKVDFLTSNCEATLGRGESLAIL